MHDLRDTIKRDAHSIKFFEDKSNPNILVLHSEYRDEFDAKLPKIINFLSERGFRQADVYRITAMIGELGNNTFDHNLGKWPTEFIGCMIALRWQKEGSLLEIIVDDLGIGFLESLKMHAPAPTSEIEAIMLALSGVTGRVGEKRGNGLRSVIAWMKQYYDGILYIHSGSGAVEITKNKKMASDQERIAGVRVYLRLIYDHTGS